MKNLIIRRQTLEAAMVCMAKNDYRYYLNGVCFMPENKIAATDGHRLSLITVLDNHNTWLEENAIIEIGKLPTKKFAVAVIDTDSKLIHLMPEFASGDYQDDDVLRELRIGVTTCRLIDGNYPDVSRVIPKKFTAVDEIGFNVTYLADAAKIAKFISERYQGAKFRFNESDDKDISAFNMKFSGTTTSAQITIDGPFAKALYVVMPIRL